MKALEVTTLLIIFRVSYSFAQHYDILRGSPVMLLRRSGVAKRGDELGDVADLKSWNEARQFCLSKGADLFAPTSRKEIEDLNFTDSLAFWTGWKENDGMWVDGEGNELNETRLWLEQRPHDSCSAALADQVNKLVKVVCNETTYDVKSFFCVKDEFDRIKEDLSWTEAKAHCEKNDGSLSNIQALPESKRDELLTSVNSSTFIWTGMHEIEGTWVDMEDNTIEAEEAKFIGSEGKCAGWVVEQKMMIRRPCDVAHFACKDFFCKRNKKSLHKYPQMQMPSTTEPTTTPMPTTTEPTTSTMPTTTKPTTTPMPTTTEPTTTEPTTTETTTTTPMMTNAMCKAEVDDGFSGHVIENECVFAYPHYKDWQQMEEEGASYCAEHGGILANPREVIHYAKRLVDIGVARYRSLWWGKGSDILRDVGAGDVADVVFRECNDCVTFDRVEHEGTYWLYLPSWLAAIELERVDTHPDRSGAPVCKIKLV